LCVYEDHLTNRLSFKVLLLLANSRNSQVESDLIHAVLFFALDEKLDKTTYLIKDVIVFVRVEWSRKRIILRIIVLLMTVCANDT